MISPQRVVDAGAGATGWTAGYEIRRHGGGCDGLDADSQVGGMGRTGECDGWRLDLGRETTFPHSYSVARGQVLVSTPSSTSRTRASRQ